MDKLSNYIQNGKQMPLRKATFIFAIISLIIGLISYGVLTYVMTSPDFQKFLTDIPTIEIQDNKVQSPQETVWERELPYTKVKFVIDTTKDELSVPANVNAFYLSKTKYYFVNVGQIQTNPLPKEGTIITGEMLKEAIPNLTRSLALSIAAFILVFLFLGYLGTLCLIRIFSWLFKKSYDKPAIARSAFFSWMTIITFDLILHIFGFGFNGVIAIVFSAALAQFMLHWISQKD